MALLHEAVEEKKLDVRVVERNITRGSVSAEEAKKAQSQLPDDSENASWVNVDRIAAEGEAPSQGLPH
jgi:hypothetical protein